MSWLDFSTGIKTESYEITSLALVNEGKVTKQDVHLFTVDLGQEVMITVDGVPPESAVHMSPLNRLLTLQCGSAWYRPIATASDMDAILTATQPVVLPASDPLAAHGRTPQTLSSLVFHLAQQRPTFRGVNNTYSASNGRTTFALPRRIDVAIVTPHAAGSVSDSCVWWVMQSRMFLTEYKLSKEPTPAPAPVVPASDPSIFASFFAQKAARAAAASRPLVLGAALTHMAASTHAHKTYASGHGRAGKRLRRATGAADTVLLESNSTIIATAAAPAAATTPENTPAAVNSTSAGPLEAMRARLSARKVPVHRTSDKEVDELATLFLETHSKVTAMLKVRSSLHRESCAYLS